VFEAMIKGLPCCIPLLEVNQANVYINNVQREVRVWTGGKAGKSYKSIDICKGGVKIILVS
jgi:hypothetical protein